MLAHDFFNVKGFIGTDITDFFSINYYHYGIFIVRIIRFFNKLGCFRCALKTINFLIYFSCFNQ